MESDVGRCAQFKREKINDSLIFEMDRMVQSVPDRTVTVDRTGPDRGLFRAPSRSGLMMGRSSFHLKMDHADPSRVDPRTGPDRTVDRAGPWTGPPSPTGN
jgi:hypothetical protein